MATRALKPDDDSMLAGWQSMPEQAPSIVREDQPTVARFLGLMGVFLLAVGAIAILVPTFGWRYIIDRTWGMVFGTTGLSLLLFHAFADGEVQFRRLYAFAAVVLVLCGAVLRVLPAGRAGLGGWFLPYGIPAMALGYLFILAVLRYETEAFWRHLLLRLLALFGFAMIAASVVVGLFNPEFLAGEGIVLLILGTFFVGGFIGQQASGSDAGYYSGLALGAIALFAIGAATIRSLATPGYFIPSGLSLMGVGVIHLAIALGVCSDAPLVVLVRRELAAFFFSPIAYLVLFGSTLVSWLNFLWITNMVLGAAQDGAPIFEPIVRYYQGNLVPVIIQMFIVPALTMRLLSEEQRSGTLEMLLTAPVNESTVVLSKFIAVLIFWLITWAPSFLFLVGLRTIGGEPFDYRPLLSFALALIATGAGFMAMGLFFSSITRNQVIAAVLTFVVMMVYLCMHVLQMGTRNPFWQNLLTYLSFFDMWEEFLGGNFAPRLLIFHISAAVFFLYLSVKVLEARKWK